MIQKQHNDVLYLSFWHLTFLSLICQWTCLAMLKPEVQVADLQTDIGLYT